MDQSWEGTCCRVNIAREQISMEAVDSKEVHQSLTCNSEPVERVKGESFECKPAA